MVVQSGNWSLWHKIVQVVCVQLHYKYSEECSHMDF